MLSAQREELNLVTCSLSNNLYLTLVNYLEGFFRHDYQLKFSNKMFATLIAKYAGFDGKISKSLFQASLLYPRFIFQFETPEDQISAVVETINGIFPEWDANQFIDPRELRISSNLLFGIAIDTAQFISTLDKTLPEFLKSHPEFIAYFQREKQILTRFTTFVGNINNLLAQYNYCTEKNDCLEDALCYLAKQRAEKLQIDPNEFKEIISTKSLFDLNSDSIDHIDFYLTTPVSNAKYIRDYLNELMQNSAYLEEKPVLDSYFQQGVTKLSVSYAVLESVAFQTQLETHIKNLPRKVREKYLQQREVIAKTSEDCITELQQLKTNLINIADCPNSETLKNSVQNIDELLTELAKEERSQQVLDQASEQFTFGISVLDQLSSSSRVISTQFNCSIGTNPYSACKSQFLILKNQINELCESSTDVLQQVNGFLNF